MHEENMHWTRWNQRKPDRDKDLVVYWVTPVGPFFLEGQCTKNGHFVEYDGNIHRGLSDETRWIYKTDLINFLSEHWE